ncbi:MAG TPA: DegV family protein [Candidatus Caccalectryoclostridium excrementigallinarum]|uniref:DegV family protein n=1 Tax=Candidatus Caccalectryoclostridium excrementigallinarum TaxID=2840710 RepID=A0A9D1MM27_9FIRM|nr:DegV family protein [Candidatus Caccalectryoclostridium excrementigallinarum]
MSIFIFSDTTADYPADAPRKDVEILPMAVRIGNDEYDNINSFITAKEFYTRMRGGEMGNTSMVQPFLAQERFEEKLKAGYDVLYLAFSSALSGTYAGCARVAKELAEKYPERKIIAVDSLNASMGEGLLLWYTVKKRDEGASFEELCEYVKYLVEKGVALFTVDDLTHLARLGRCSKASAMIGTLMNIKPVLHVDEQGRLMPYAKVMSRKKALKALVDGMEERMLPASEQKKVYIGHGDCLDDANLVKKMIQDRFGIEDVEVGDIGPVIGTHTNAGVVALFFLGNSK